METQSGELLSVVVLVGAAGTKERKTRDFIVPSVISFWSLVTSTVLVRRDNPGVVTLVVTS